jgi:uncharacterized damage-inducible protein DinB
MRSLRRFLSRLKDFATGRQDDQRLREEMEEHLAQQTAENLRAGMMPAEARRQAVLKFGAAHIASKLNGWSRKELPMKKTLIQYGVCALALALMAPLAQAQAQPAGMQAAWGKDAGTLSGKFTALARVMAGKYDWKPGQGVRSVGDVFNLIVKENGMLAGVLSGTPNAGAPPAPITDPEKMQEALKASYVNLQTAIAGLSDADLQTPVKLFGRDMTKQGALMLLLEDQHEHLGQSIAYARTNGVVPPWSK